jgi:hypothetical protein
LVFNPDAFNQGRFGKAAQLAHALYASMVEQYGFTTHKPPFLGFILILRKFLSRRPEHFAGKIHVYLLDLSHPHANELAITYLGRGGSAPPLSI